ASSTAKSRLNALVGGALTNHMYSAIGALDKQIRMELPAPEAAYAMALQTRPDINALRWKVEQARSNMGVEERRAYPTVTMSGLYTRQYQLKAIGFPDADSWGASVGLPLPIWDRNQGNRIKAESAATQSLFALEAGELDLWSEIESVLAELTAARDNAT